MIFVIRSTQSKTKFRVIKVYRMKILFYSTKKYERSYLTTANSNNYGLVFCNEPLSLETASLAKGYDCISIFTNDDASAEVIEKLYANGIKYIVIRATGYDNIDLEKANDVGIKVANVPNYSPYSIAEHSLCLLLAAARNLLTANKQVQEQNFTIENLVGFTLHKKTVGIIGTGKIGTLLVKILHGFNCNILAYDIAPNNTVELTYGAEYTSLENLCRSCDIISIHLPLNENTKYLINKKLVSQMPKGVIIINTARGAVVNTVDIIDYLKNGHIGCYGMDVYEKEKGIFFYNHKGRKMKDPQLLQLMAMPNVIITPHQAFATDEALKNIADTTFHNIACWANRTNCENELHEAPLVRQENLYNREEV
jgi:D-lactate dehydrogenase